MKLLVTGGLGFIGYFSAEHFANSLGWPVTLVLMGVAFLGVGIQAPTPEWGAMISEGRKYILDYWWVATIPGIAIFAISLAFNLLGDGLRDVLDPKEDNS